MRRRAAGIGAIQKDKKAAERFKDKGNELAETNLQVFCFDYFMSVKNHLPAPFCFLGLGSNSELFVHKDLFTQSD
jgi:alanine dehydrogenase